VQYLMTERATRLRPGPDAGLDEIDKSIAAAPG